MQSYEKLRYARHGEGESFVEREFFGSDVEGIEGVGAVGAVFEQGFFGLCEFFARLVFAEAVAASADSGGLDCQNQIFVVGAVEKGHEAVLTGEALVDEKVFLIVSHGVTDVDGFNRPTMFLKLMDYYPTEILLVDGIV